MATKKDMAVTADWQSLNAFYAITVGESFGFQIKSGGIIVLSEGSKPAAAATDGPIFSHAMGITMVTAGREEVWVKSYDSHGHQKLAAWPI